MARRDGMSDWEFDRRMEDSDRRRGRYEDDDPDGPFMIFIYIGIGVVVVVAGAGWLDHQFGWGLTLWIMSLLKGGH